MPYAVSVYCEDREPLLYAVYIFRKTADRCIEERNKCVPAMFGAMGRLELCQFRVHQVGWHDYGVDMRSFLVMLWQVTKYVCRHPVQAFKRVLNGLSGEG